MAANTAVVSANPLAEKQDVSEKPTTSSHGNKLKAFMLLGLVGGAGALGYYLGGQGNTTPEVVSPVPANPVAEATKSVELAFADQSNIALTGKLNPDQLNELLNAYESDPLAWDDAQLSEDIMKSLKIIRDSHLKDLENIRSLETTTDKQTIRGGYRQLAGQFREELVQFAWDRIENENYNGAIKDGDDRVAVRRVNNQCVVVAEESNSLEDWINNLDLGSEDIQSLKKYNIRAESCGCEKKTLWWCSRFRTCSTTKVIGRGFDGFVKVYNRMRNRIWDRMKSVCQPNDQIVLAGFSRGAGIMSILAHSLSSEGIYPNNKIKMVTFGSPRTLDKGTSDNVHNKFEQWRMVYKKDPVPSIPYGWMGYKHHGEMRCNSCGYSESRDKPNWSWIVDGLTDHTKYKEWF